MSVKSRSTGRWARISSASWALSAVSTPNPFSDSIRMTRSRAALSSSTTRMERRSATVSAGSCPPRKEPSHSLCQLAGANRLLHTSLRARGDGDPEIARIDTGDGDDLQLGALGKERSSQLDPIHLRHRHVGHNRVDRVLVEALQSITPVGGRLHRESSTSQHAAQQVAYHLVVIDNEDGRSDLV